MRNRHTLSHEHKLTTDMGYLVPVATMEVLPGDTFVHRTSMFIRVAPLANPVMHNVEVRLHHWFVANRNLWEHWETFAVGNEDGQVKPKVTVPVDPADSNYWLLDHMGLPASGKQVDALPVRAYNAIWNRFYRDQDLDTERDPDELSLAKIRWEKDYLTAARPFAQVGEPFDIPFAAGAKAPITGLGYNQSSSTDGSATVTETGGGSATYNPSRGLHQSGLIVDLINGKEPNIYADLTAVDGAGIDVNDLRRNIAMQKIAEARMAFGSRYPDFLRYLGLNPQHDRFDEPEFLGGGSQHINFSEVLATAEGATTSVGDMYGHGIAGLRARRYRRRFEEHGWLLSLISVRPKTVYMDGIDRQFMREKPEDYWQPELEVLPWQEIKETEVHHAGDANAVWGYAPQYDEYRHIQSYVSGEMRDLNKDWHMARDFQSLPTLNASFVECDPTTRIYQDFNMRQLLINCVHDIQAKRLVSANARIGGSVGL